MGEDQPFNALADPVRRQILSVLAEHKELAVGELCQHVTQIGRTGISSHLRVLRDANLVVERRSGRYRFYSVHAEGAAQDVIGLLQSIFQSSLDDLKSVAETGAGGPAAQGDGGRLAG